MSIKKLECGNYLVDMRPNGRNGKRIRRKFAKKHEAIAFERWNMAKEHNKPWLPTLKDMRPLPELIRVWWAYHGQHSKWGARNKGRLERVSVFLGQLGARCAFQIDASIITAYRSFKLGSGIKASTINRELASLGGMFTVLIASGLYKGRNPLAEVCKLRVAPVAMTYLTTQEIDSLLARLDGDNYKIAVFCLSTGARWSEAAELRAEHVVNRLAMFVMTKNGRSRTVPVSPDLEQLISTTGQGLLFPGANYEQIRQTLKETKPSIPKGQGLHILRHTYATHFMINGGNIVTLQRILGHANIQQTMTYAHFAPDYLADAVRLNPLKGGAGDVQAVAMAGGAQ
ncbi:integrase [Aeromonas veronii]|uniref:Integrase n=1 Tax=Aeromonas veronii TaxID=654 RepID=A0A3A9IFV7_AERVE|nr:tyrosine-type recombinase/integrase [Aeromonas veronii]RKJ89765.1 integrase [Aeromonas veronii]